MAARRKCIALMSAQIIEAKAAMDKERKIRMEFDTETFDILIDNCCSHTLTNDRMIKERYTVSYYQTHIIHPQ